MPSDQPVPRFTAANVAAVVVGNVVEFYDFTTYAFFALQIGRAFFPAHGAYGQLMLSLATFGVGFVGRPLGGAVLGRLGDRVGRKPAMLLSLALMGVAVLMIAAVPSYRVIGVAAPILVVAARLVQGFAVGGEVGPSTAFLLEAAPPAQRGFYASWQFASQSAALLAGGLVGVLLSRALDAESLQAWGWRVAFALGGLILPVGWLIRRKLPETLDAPETLAAAPPARDGAAFRTALVAMGVVSTTTISFYVLIYMTTYAVATLHYGPGPAFATTLVGGAAGVVFHLVGGAASDRFGRRRVMIWPRAAYLLAILPGFWLLTRVHAAAVLLGVAAVLNVLSAISNGAIVANLAEAFPKSSRSGTLGLVYALALALFGGTTQLVVTWLMHRTGDAMWPGYYLAIATLLSLPLMSWMPETAPSHLAERKDGGLR